MSLEKQNYSRLIGTKHLGSKVSTLPSL